MADILNEAIGQLVSNLKPIEIQTFSINIEDVKKEMITENSWIADDRSRPERPLGNLFRDLDKIQNDCLYWFEVDSNEIADKMVTALNDFRIINNTNLVNHRRVPAKGKYNGSKILYVGTRQGKVRKRDGLTTIASRTFQHLGFYEKGSTGALHFWYWAKHSVKLNVIELPVEMSKYRNVLETLLAIKLKPVIGTH